MLSTSPPYPTVVVDDDARAGLMPAGIRWILSRTVESMGETRPAQRRRVWRKDDYSALNAFIGSTRAARRDGTNPAVSATSVKTVADTPNTTGSALFISNNNALA